MVAVNQEVLIFIRAIDQASGTFQSIAKTLGKLNTSIRPLDRGVKNLSGRIHEMRSITDAVTDSTLRYGASSNSLVKSMIKQHESTGQVTAKTGAMNKEFFTASQMMGMDIQKFKEINTTGRFTTTTVGRLVNGFRRFTHGLRGFRMEMLGVMFFGMGMQRMFMGLLQPAMQLAGIFEIWGAILQLLFLPVALLMLPTMLGLLDTITNMDEPTKVLIGSFAIFGAIIGTLLFLVGTLALGLGSITLAFGPLIGWLGKLFGAASMGAKGFLGLHSAFALGGIGAAIMSKALAILIGWVLPLTILAGLLYAAWVFNTQGIKLAIISLQNAFWRVFANLRGIIEGFVDFFQAIVAGDANRAFEALKKIARSAVDYIIGVFFDLVPAVLEVLRNLLWGIGAFVVKLGITFFDLGGKIVDALARGIASAGSAVAIAMRNMIPEPFRGWLKSGTQAIGGTVRAVTKALPIPVQQYTPAPAKTAKDYLAPLFSGSFQHGGLVTKPTMALLGEAGPEMVTPLGEGLGTTTISPTYYINATVSNDMDIRALAERLNEMLTSDYRRLTYR